MKSTTFFFFSVINFVAGLYPPHDTMTAVCIVAGILSMVMGFILAIKEDP